MDALARANEALARARGRSHVITPEDATSPMDAASTVQIPRLVITAVDPERDCESTMVIPPVDGVDGTHGWDPQPGR
jgi:hypothetical protein